VSSNVGIDNTLFVNSWHGKPGDALPPQHSSAGNGASGSIAGLPSRPYSTRNASVCSCCVAAHRHMPCWYGVIANHLPPCPTKSPTQRSSVIPSGIEVCRYHKEGGFDEPIVLVVAQVEGIGLVLQILEILEGGCRVCPWPSGLHKLQQHWTYLVFGRIILILNPTLPPMLLLNISHRLRVIRHHCRILPSLCGPYKSRPGCPIVSDGYATAQNACYRSILIDMYMDWSGCDFQELISYLEILRSTDISMWPSSSDDDVWCQEYSVQRVVTNEQWAAAVGI
jgi:hypothetical protein